MRSALPRGDRALQSAERRVTAVASLPLRPPHRRRFEHHRAERRDTLAIRSMMQHRHCQVPIAAGMVHLTGGGTAMKVIVLKVRNRENLDELDEVIHQGRTLEGGLGGWQMPKDAQLGDLAIWYAASPDQEYRAYGWVSGIPRKPESELVKYYGSVAGVRSLPTPRARVWRWPRRADSTRRAWASSRRQSMSAWMTSCWRWGSTGGS